MNYLNKIRRKKKENGITQSSGRQIKEGRGEEEERKERISQILVSFHRLGLLERRGKIRREDELFWCCYDSFGIELDNKMKR